MANKKGVQHEKSALKKDSLTKMSDAPTVCASLSNNGTALQNNFTEKMITHVFKSSFLNAEFPVRKNLSSASWDID